MMKIFKIKSLDKIKQDHEMKITYETMLVKILFIDF